MIPAPSAGRLLTLSRTSANLCRRISNTCALYKNKAGKYKSTIDRSQMLTYEMAQKPHHIGVRKAWLTWHSQNLEDFRQMQGVAVAQDDAIRRFMIGFFPQNIVIDGTEIVVKKRGNVTYVTGFMHYTRRLEIRKIYWMFGFAEEFLSHLMKQPVKLEFQFVPDEKELAYNWI